MKLFKLRFSNKEEWDTVKGDLLIPNEDGEFPSKSTYTSDTIYGLATIVEIGHIPIPAVLDEDGEVITEATLHSDYAVDTLLRDDVEESVFSANGFMVEVDKPYHNFI